MIRRHMVFYGEVQGVGFRWRARNAAGLYGCTGWAVNRPDGAVEMEIQGEREAVDRLILSIEEGRFVRIENMESETVPPEEGEYGFRTD